MEPCQDQKEESVVSEIAVLVSKRGKPGTKYIALQDVIAYGFSAREKRILKGSTSEMPTGFPLDIWYIQGLLIP